MAASGDTTQLSQLVKTYYDKRLIARLEPRTFLHQFAEKRPIPGGSGKTIEFTGYRNMKPIVTNSSETANNQVAISAYTITATLIQRHNYVQFSDLLTKTSIDPRVSGAVDVLGDQMAKTVEIYLRQQIVGQVGTAARSSASTHDMNVTLARYDAQGTVTGTSAQRTHHFWSTYPCLHNKARLASSGADIAVMAGSAASLNQVKHGVQFLRARDVEPVMGTQDYIFYCHSWVADSLMGDPEWGDWNKPNDAQAMFNGEVGKIFGARVVVSNAAFRYAYSAAPLTTASGAFNASFLFGKGAFGATEINGGSGGRGFEIIVKNPDSSSTNDPANLISTVAGKMTMAAAVLNKSAGACVINTDKVATSGT